MYSFAFVAWKPWNVLPGTFFCLMVRDTICLVLHAILFRIYDVSRLIETSAINVKRGIDATQQCGHTRIANVKITFKS